MLLITYFTTDLVILSTFVLSPETEPDTEPEPEPELEPEPEPSIYVNIRDFGLRLRICLFGVV